MNLKKIGKFFGLGVAVAVFIATVAEIGVGQVTMQCVNAGKRETCNQASFIITTPVQRISSIGFPQAPTRLISPINPGSVTHVRPLNITLQQKQPERRSTCVGGVGGFCGAISFNKVPPMPKPSVIEQYERGVNHAVDLFSIVKFTKVAKAGKASEIIKSAPDAIIGAFSISKDFSKIIRPPTNITEPRQ